MGSTGGVFCRQADPPELHLLLCREPGYEEPWVIVTDLAPQQVQGAWYRLRAWIEGGFKDYKRGQWGWQHTRCSILNVRSACGWP